MAENPKTKRFIAAVSAYLQKVAGTDEPIQTTQEPPKVDPTSASTMLTAMKRVYFGDVYGKIKTQTRHDLYDSYDYLDENLAEAAAALNIYSDNIVSGAIGGAENYEIVIEAGEPQQKELEEIIKITEEKTGIKDIIWDLARDMQKYGDLFEEVVIGQENGNYWIEKLKTLPVKEIYADVDERGVFYDSDFPYYQKKEESSDKRDIQFPSWQIIHFRMGRDVYGAKKSIFANASRRIGRQLLWIDDCLCLSRITRAWMRYAFIVDTEGFSEDQKWAYIERFRERIRTKEIINRDTGQIQIMDSHWLPDEDIILPVSKEGKTDVRSLTGDPNVGEIEDVNYFQTKFLMAVAVPKAYVSKEEGTRAKATITQIDVQFARQVRRRQRAMLPGLRQFYETAFYLAGKNPKDFKWNIIFPELATHDEVLKWEMMEIKAKIAEILCVKVGALNNDWVMRELLDFSDEDIEKYAAYQPSDELPPEEMFQIPRESWTLIRRDPNIRQLIDDMHDIVAYKKAREEALKDKEEPEEELAKRNSDEE